MDFIDGVILDMGKPPVIKYSNIQKSQPKSDRPIYGIPLGFYLTIHFWVDDFLPPVVFTVYTPAGIFSFN